MSIRVYIKEFSFMKKELWVKYNVAFTIIYKYTKKKQIAACRIGGILTGIFEDHIVGTLVSAKVQGGMY